MKLFDIQKNGFGVKKWVAVSVAGVSLLVTGIMLTFKDMIREIKIDKYATLSICFIGIIILGIGIRSYTKVLVDTLCKYASIKTPEKGSIDKLIFKEKSLKRGPNITVIGGGTGISVLLRGLKEHTMNLTAVVTVADDGGGSGKLREDLGILPPGDIRNCLLALADAEPKLKDVLQHRFSQGELKGQSFGNLFLASMIEIYGDFNKAIQEMSNVLDVKGEVFPMTLENVNLHVKLKNGKIIEGESAIPKMTVEYGSPIEKISVEPKKINPLRESVDRIRKSDCIVIGPGSLYTSIIPNLLVNKIPKEIYSSKGSKIYIANIMTQRGETDGFSLLKHVQEIEKYSKKSIIDYVIVNDKVLPSEMKNKLEKEKIEQIFLTEEEECFLNEKNIKVIKADILEIENHIIRHNSKALSDLIMKIILEEKIFN